VTNVAKKPGSDHFRGIINPDLNLLISQWAPDAILVLGWSFESHLKCLLHFHRKIPILFRGDSTMLDKRSAMGNLARRIFLTWVYRHVNYALAVGQNNSHYFLANGLRKEQLVPALHAVDNDRFAEPDDLYRREAREMRQRLGIGENDLVILFAGKLEPKKDPYFLLQLARRLNRRDIQFVLVGNGRLEEGLKASATGLSGVTFLDFQNQSIMPVIYRLADIYILPSTGPNETWGLGANEAMASGCVIMLSDKVGGAIDLIEEGKNGIVFRAGDEGKCSAFIHYLLTNRDALMAMKRHSREKVRQFSYDGILDAILSILNGPVPVDQG
jgi:glycosyltransferase involved in cell wall biosynthesis